MSNILFSKKFISKLTTIIRSFWWTGVREERTSRALCLRAWKDICTPKKEGGLGIRNLQAVNQSLILMAAWRIAQNPDDMLHKVLKAKYFQDSSIWRPKPNAPKSAFWASILKVLPLLKVHSFYQITQGNISIWSSPWCQSWNTIYDDLIIQTDNFVYPALVSDLWLPNQKVWNENLIDSLFSQPTAQVIKQTSIIPSQDQDLLCWNLTTNGKCTSKSAYYACLQGLYDSGEPRPREVSLATKQVLNQVWKNKQIIPRIKAFAWRFLRRAIPTGARAGKYSKHISKLCCRCGLEEDDIHLFFTCPFVKAAWFIAPWYIRTDLLIQNCSSLTQIILNLLKMNHPHASLNNILTFMWCTWKSRNDALFDRKKGEPYQINLNAQALHNNLELYAPLDSKLQDNLPQEPDMMTADPEQGSTLRTDLLITGATIFSDASWKCKKIPGAKGTMATGIGVFIRYKAGARQFVIMIQASTSLTSSVLQAEAKALLLAAKLTKLLNINRPTFLTDNQILAKAAASRRLDHPLLHWNTRHTMASFFDISATLAPQVFHIKRDLNGVAHDCAHQVLRQSLSQPIFSCICPAHSSPTCPAISTLENFVCQDFVINAVWCV
jgi:ribonuclease HI